MKIDKDTLLYGSLSKEPGSFGASLFNAAFEQHGINAIYKPFKIVSPKRAAMAMIELDIKGLGVSMPFKRQIVDYCTELSPEAEAIGTVNTVINEGCYFLRGYNTDWLAAKAILEKYHPHKVFILGNGGYSKAIQYACHQIEKQFELITRDNWDVLFSLREQFIFNATPLELKPDDSNIYIDCLVSTPTGQELARTQASHQFKLYTGIDHTF